MAEDSTGEPGDEDDVTDGTEGPAASPLADEARRLLSAVQDWAQRTMPEPPSGHGGPECQWCPLCQFASILRGEHPEVTDRVAEAGTALAGAVRALVESAVSHAAPPADSADSADSGDADDASPRAKPKPTPRVQRIHLDDES